MRCLDTQVKHQGSVCRQVVPVENSRAQEEQKSGEKLVQAKVRSWLWTRASVVRRIARVMHR